MRQVQFIAPRPQSGEDLLVCAGRTRPARPKGGVVSVVLVVAAVLSIPSCSLRKPKTVQAAPPTPAPAAAPAPPPAPLSVPQTQVPLPPPQPLTPEAIATTVPPQEPAPAPAPSRPAPVRSRPAQQHSETPAVPAGPVAPPELERPPIQEVLPAAELKRLQEEAQARKREVRQLVEPLDPRRLSPQQRGILDRIESFVTQSDDAEQRGDMRQASELAQRALVLARELKP